MPDSITVQNDTGNYFSRLMDSIKGIGIGLLLFIISFVVLFNSEGGTDFSKLANKAIPVDATVAEATANDGNFVALEGKLTTDETIGDQITFANGVAVQIQPSTYISLRRSVEYFSWVEKSKTTSGSDSKSSSTTYTYDKKWTSDVKDSASFHLSKNHENPVMAINNSKLQANGGKVGEVTVDINKLGLPSGEKLVLNSELVEITTASGVIPVVADAVVDTNESTAEPDAFVTNTSETGTTTTDFVTTSDTETPNTPPEVPASKVKTATLIDGTYVYYGANYAAPALGDMRINYDVLKSGGQVTAFGKLNGTSLVAYVEGDNSLYRAFTGTKEEALNSMHGEFVFYLWFMRFLGFLMMWIGLGMVLAPLSAVLDFLPLIGGVSKSVISGITFVVAMALTVITVLVSKVAHNPLIMVIMVLILAGGVYVWISGQTKKQQSEIAKP